MAWLVPGWGIVATLTRVVSRSRFDYLKNQLDSLRAVRGIDQAILLISQDLITNDIEAVTGSVDFMVYARIFNPYSLQLNVDRWATQHNVQASHITWACRFPGKDPSDCRPDEIPKPATCKMATWRFLDQVGVTVLHDAISACLGAAATPLDLEDRLRLRPDPGAQAAQWLEATARGMRCTFAHLEQTHFLLQEDYFLAPDVLDIIPKAAKEGFAMCPTCSLLVVGAHDQSVVYNQPTTVSGLVWEDTHGMVVCVGWRHLSVDGSHIAGM